ncbi:hypothetical protein [Tautonia marina]|uniref:hypothetical protein n=1 Tax=Tautonia marina TaxID=2653855 RepID=UPI00126058FA|nr:hypothetical protein [Tautonia marina]
MRSTPDRRPSPDRWESEPGSGRFLWLTWGLMLAVALGFVGRFGPRVPLWDDYDVIPVLTQHRPMSLEWLWSLHSEHRLVLPRLVLLAAFHLTDADFRAGMVVNVALLAALAALAPLAIGMARGGWRYSDALYPLLFLNLGHHINLIWNMSVSYILPVVLSGFTALLIAMKPGFPGLGRGVLIGLTLLLLPLCNAAGVALAPLPALWLLGAAGIHARSVREDAWSRALPLALLASVSLVVSMLYFVDYERSTHHPRPPGLWAIGRTILQFLGTGLGAGGMELGLVGGGIVAALVAAAFLVLARSALVVPADRSRAWGLLACWGAMAMLMFGTAWGRAGMGERAGAQERYVTLATTALLISVVGFERFGPGSTRRLVPMSVFCLLCVLLWPNTRSAIEFGRSTKQQAETFFADLHSGVPRFLLVRRHTPFVYPSHDELTRHLAMLQQAGIEPFDRIAPDPPFREVVLDLEPSRLQLARWNGQTIESLGADPQVVFEVPDAVSPIAGIRLRYSHSNSEGEPARFKLAWRRPGQHQFPADQEYAVWALPTGTGRSTTIWIGEAVDAIRLQPDNRPCHFRIEQLSLLVPSASASDHRVLESAPQADFKRSASLPLASGSALSPSTARPGGSHQGQGPHGQRGGLGSGERSVLMARAAIAVLGDLMTAGQEPIIPPSLKVAILKQGDRFVAELQLVAGQQVPVDAP